MKQALITFQKILQLKISSIDRRTGTSDAEYEEKTTTTEARWEESSSDHHQFNVKQIEKSYNKTLKSIHVNRVSDDNLEAFLSVDKEAKNFGVFFGSFEVGHQRNTNSRTSIRH